LVDPDFLGVEVADDRPEFLATKAVGPGVEFVVRVVEESGLEVPQRPKLRDGLVPKFAVELDVMIMLAGSVIDHELPGQVQREDGRSLEGVSPVLEEKAISVWRVRGVEALGAEAHEPDPHLVQVQFGEGLLSTAQLMVQSLLGPVYGRSLRHSVLRGLDGICGLAVIFSAHHTR
jgi:hypothetical protein